jgi:RNA polymerase sigma-70 factor (ECF subfamily)
MNESISTESVWHEFSAQLRGFIRRRVRDDAAADDLLQETFLKIHTRLPQLKSRDKLAPWIYRIARNTLLDHFRHERHETLELSGDWPVANVTIQEADAAEMNQIVGFWLRGFLATMPYEYRQAVEMIELEGKTIQELADAAQLSLSGAKSRVQRGRKMLRERLHDCCHVELDKRGNVLSTRSNACCIDTEAVVMIQPAKNSAAVSSQCAQTRAGRGFQENRSATLDFPQRAGHTPLREVRDTERLQSPKLNADQDGAKEILRET